MKIIIKNSKNEEVIYLEGNEYLNNPNEYKFLYDEEHDIEEFNKIIKNDYKFHNNVLPHPFFGNIEESDILFLAKNPLYSNGYEDEISTYVYLNRHNGNLSNYLNDLKNVNFFGNWNDASNVSFYSSCRWWQKLFGNIKLKENKYFNKIGFLNLCGYQSKSYTNKHFKFFPSIDIDSLKESIKNAKVVIVVWKSIADHLGNDFFKDTPCLSLNKGLRRGYNTIHKILYNTPDTYNEEHEMKAIEVLNKYFE